MTDPYTDPATGVLRNLLGISEADKLARYEAELSQVRALERRRATPAPPFDLARLQEIHGRLFGDVYEWAGQLRTVFITKVGVPFAAADRIEVYAERKLDELAQEHNLVLITDRIGVPPRERTL